MLRNIIDGYCKVLHVLMVIALAIMVILVFGNVVLRYIFNSGITVSDELSRWLFVWVTFLGAVAAMRDGAHLGTDMLVSRLGKTGQKICLVLGHALMLYCCWLLLQGSLQQVKVNLGATSPTLGVSMGIFYASGVVCATSIAVILIDNLWRLLKGDLSETELIGIRESEEEPIDLPVPLK
ncbi:TRAP transporter small permease [Cupriavidus sp. P-10]|uniref:TRAP transporter small permease n=1 Tax=Cupriavidus sp. P-10 TaxID=2027911 RepID=UPI0018F11194|nr:TRAP transporter small permease [Cupriavidus sp. P-10]BDB27282.1 TRAP transporter small permease [Cupriavidus sp. P-10]